MTAADHRTIIEKGADYRIDIQVSENGIDNKDVTDYSVEMVIKYQDTNGDIAVLDTIAGFLVEDSVGSGTYLNGNVSVVIDKSITSTYATLVDEALSPFATEYNYFYGIDITEDIATSVDKDNIRILRGKLAIRE